MKIKKIYQIVVSYVFNELLFVWDSEDACYYDVDCGYVRYSVPPEAKEIKYAMIWRCKDEN